MDIKQKSLLVLTIAALGFLGYQIFELVGRDISETPTMAASSTPTYLGDSSAKANAHPVLAEHKASVPPRSNVKPAHARPVSTQAATPTSTSTSTTAQPGMNSAQQSYVKMLNTFEVEKMHRQLLDEEAAVATAQHQIAMLHQQTSKITGNDTGNDVSDMNTAPLALSYVDKQRGVWSATLRINRQYQTVNVGSKLKSGYQVIAIDRQGILLQKGQQRERLTFNGIQVMPALAPTVPTQLAAAFTTQSAAKQPASTLLPYATQGITHDQAHLLAMQVANHAKEVHVVARHALATTKPRPAAPVIKKPRAIQLKKRSAPKKSIQISTHDQYATESADDREAKLLTKDLDLRDTSIDPVVNQPYSVTAYLPQQANVPRAYHLNMTLSPQRSANKYAVESADGTTSVAARHYTAKERHFLSLNHHYYTIQLIGSHDDAVVKQFLVDNEMTHIAVPMVVGDPKKPWNIAIYGVYRSFDAAEHKLVHLPHRLRVNGAWIRKVGDIQSVLREYHHV